MKCKCGGGTSVTTTQKLDNGVFRRRKCHSCGANFQTMEAVIEPKYKKDRLDALPPAPEEKDVYTKTEALQIKQRVVAARRLNEDRRDRALQYLAEDDFDL